MEDNRVAACIVKNGNIIHCERRAVVKDKEISMAEEGLNAS